MKYYGLVYGLIIAISYLVIKVLAQDLHATYFTVSCGCLFLGTLFFLKKKPPQLFGIILRGLLYSVTNFILLSVQNKTGVSAALTAALLGSLIIGLPPILKNLSRIKNLVIVLSLSLSIYLLRDKLALSSLAIACGLLQAGTYSITGRLMRAQSQYMTWNLASGFFWTLAMGSCIMLYNGNLSVLSQLDYMSILGIAFVIAVSQISFFILYSKFPVEDASRYSLGRIPWSYFLELSIGKTIFVPQIAIGTTLIFIAAFVQRERRSKPR